MVTLSMSNKKDAVSSSLTIAGIIGDVKLCMSLKYLKTTNIAKIPWRLIITVAIDFRFISSSLQP
jgi:hypothetical protein